MKRAISYVLIFSILMLSPLSCQGAEGRRVWPELPLRHSTEGVGRFWAFLIGINDYQDPEIGNLTTAVQDVEELGQVLVKRYGFEKPILLQDRQATRKAIDDALRQLIEDLGPEDSLLIYYAGHGDLDRLTGGGWWVPSDARVTDPSTYLDNVVIQKYLQALKARHVILISDSCYSGTLLGETRSLPPAIGDRFYLELYRTKSRWGMTSGNRTPVLDKGSGGHSLFAHHLLNLLRDNRRPYLTPREIYGRIGPIIRNNAEQMPLCLPIRNTGDEGGEFVFLLSESSSFQVNYLYRPGGMEAPRPITKESVLHSGDHYKVLFTPDEDAFVYIFQVDTAGQIFQLFPMREFKGVVVNNYNPVSKGKTYTLPAEKKSFKLDRQVGRERLYFLAFKERNQELEGLYRELEEARRRRDEGRAEDAQEKLGRHFKRRGVEGIVTDRAIQVVWGESEDPFKVFGQRLENLCEDCVHVIEFRHE